MRCTTAKVLDGGIPLRIFCSGPSQSIQNEWFRLIMGSQRDFVMENLNLLSNRLKSQPFKSCSKIFARDSENLNESFTSSLKQMIDEIAAIERAHDGLAWL